MTTTFLFVRHAVFDNLENMLAGRTIDSSLNARGRGQANLLGVRLAGEKPCRILSSPRKRAQETAMTIAQVCGRQDIETTADLDEIDFGAWSGRSFECLKTDPDWQKWNAARSVASTPAGDTMHLVRERVAHLLDRCRSESPGQKLVLVSHCDVIKAAVMGTMGLPMDKWSDFDIAPASITTIVAGGWGSRVFAVNETLDWNGAET